MASTDANNANKTDSHKDSPTIAVKRIHRRDLNRVWDFLKLVFRDVNRETDGGIDVEIVRLSGMKDLPVNGHIWKLHAGRV